MTEPSFSRRDALAGSLGLATATAAGAALGAPPGTPYRRIEIGSQQGIATLRMVDSSAPAPATGEVLVATRAAALNYRDLLLTESRYGGDQPETRVPLSDGAGDVVAVGDGVEGFAIGDRVTAPHFLNWIDGAYSPAATAADVGIRTDGWLSELVLLPAASLIRLPDGMDYANAAALGVAGITAWSVLEALGNIKPSDTVLTLGTGGVATVALQIAKMNGARVAITSSSDDKLATVRELGADITVNYRKNPQWEQAVREATGGRGVDIVVETVGLGTLTQSLACCAPNARVGLLGGLDRGEGKPLNLSALYFANIVLKGITSGSRQMYDDLLLAAAQNGMRPYIDQRFAFEDAKEAYRHLAEAGHVGKVVIDGFV